MRDKTYNKTYVTSKDSDQPVHQTRTTRFLVYHSLDNVDTAECKCDKQRLCITKTSLFKYTENLNTKTENFQIKKINIFHISVQNIDCGYLLEPPCRGGSNEYPQSMFLAGIRKIMCTPVNPSFTIQEDHDGPISLTWANRFAYLMLKFQPSSLL